MANLEKILKGYCGELKDDSIAIDNVARYGHELVAKMGIEDEVYNEEGFLPPRPSSSSSSVSHLNNLSDSDYEHLSSYEIERLCKALGITVKTYQERIKRGLTKREALTVKKHYNNVNSINSISRLSHH